MRLGLRWRRRPRRCRRHAHTSLRVQSVRDRRGAWSTAARSCASCWDRSSGELASSRRRLHSSSGATMHWRRPRELWRRSAARCSITLIGKVSQESGYCPMQCSGARRVRAHAARTSNQAHTHMRGAPNALTACALPRLCCRQSRLCVRRTFPTPRANRTGLHFRSSLCDRRRRPR